MAANPLGAHQVGRDFADRVAAYVVTIFAGVPVVRAVRYACFTLMVHLDLRNGLSDREPAAIIGERARMASGILDFHDTWGFAFSVFNNVEPKSLSMGSNTEEVV